MTISFLKDDGTKVPLDTVGLLGPKSRTTIHASDVTNLGGAFSTTVETPFELAVERTMRWGDTGYGAHTEKASDGPASQWFFAEGSQGFFFTYFLLVNPQATANAAHVTYFREGAPPIVRDYALAPNSRRTIDVGEDAGLVDTSFGARIDFDQPGMARSPPKRRSRS